MGTAAAWNLIIAASNLSASLKADRRTQQRIMCAQGALAATEALGVCYYVAEAVEDDGSIVGVGSCLMRNAIGVFTNGLSANQRRKALRASAFLDHHDENSVNLAVVTGSSMQASYNFTSQVLGSKGKKWRKPAVSCTCSASGNQHCPCWLAKENLESYLHQSGSVNVWTFPPYGMRGHPAKTFYLDKGLQFVDAVFLLVKNGELAENDHIIKERCSHFKNGQVLFIVFLNDEDDDDALAAILEEISAHAVSDYFILQGNDLEKAGGPWLRYLIDHWLSPSAVAINGKLDMLESSEDPSVMLPAEEEVAWGWEDYSEQYCPDEGVPFDGIGHQLIEMDPTRVHNQVVEDK